MQIPTQVRYDGDIGDVRRGFEAWHCEKFKCKHLTGAPTRDMHGGVYDENYGPEHQQLMWEAWQAACAAAPAPPAGGVQFVGYPPIPEDRKLPPAGGEVERWVFEQNEAFVMPDGDWITHTDHIAHVTWLQADFKEKYQDHKRELDKAWSERDALKAEVERLKQVAIDRKDALTAMCAELVDAQSELTKARELLGTLASGRGISRLELDPCVAHQSAPAEPLVVKLSGPAEWLDEMRNQSAPAALIERGSTHGFEQSQNTCRHDDKSGVWWREGSVTRTGRECNACGHVDEDANQSASSAKGEEPFCLLCLDKKTVPGPNAGDFVRDCPDCCGEEG